MEFTCAVLRMDLTFPLPDGHRPTEADTQFAGSQLVFGTLTPWQLAFSTVAHCPSQSKSGLASGGT